MKTAQTQKHLGQSVAMGLLFVGMSLAIVVLMFVQSSAGQ